MSQPTGIDVASHQGNPDWDVVAAVATDTLPQRVSAPESEVATINAYIERLRAALEAK